MDQLSPIDRAVIQAECTALIHRYAILNDAGDFDAMAAMFVEDGLFARPTDPDNPTRGRAAILASYRSRPPRFTRHICANVLITPETPDRARGFSYLVLHTAKPGDGGLPRADPTALIGAFDDVFVREAGAWAFAERRGSLAMQVASSSSNI